MYSVISSSILPFQSTLPQGERHGRISNGFDVAKFQSTLPQGERPVKSFQYLSVKYFNPRSHKGSDDADIAIDGYAGISIHAPTRGATKTLPRRNVRHTDFNPRSHKGSDTVYYRYRIAQIISIHAPTRGATIVPLSPLIPPVNFNPRSHKGSDKRH